MSFSTLTPKAVRETVRRLVESARWAKVEFHKARARGEHDVALLMSQLKAAQLFAATQLLPEWFEVGVDLALPGGTNFVAVRCTAEPDGFHVPRAAWAALTNQHRRPT